MSFSEAWASFSQHIRSWNSSSECRREHHLCPGPRSNIAFALRENASVERYQGAEIRNCQAGGAFPYFFYPHPIRALLRRHGAHVDEFPLMTVRIGKAVLIHETEILRLCVG